MFRRASSTSLLARSGSARLPSQASKVVRRAVSSQAGVVSRGFWAREKVLYAGSAAALTYGIYALGNIEVHAESFPYTGVPGTNRERTFIAVKPDGVHRGLIGEVVKRFEAKGYKLVAIKFVQPTQSFAEQHYHDLAKKPFFPGLVKYFSSGPVVAMVWEGKGVIKGGRSLVGATNPDDALPGSVRGDLAIDVGRNIIHGSDGPDSAKDEISLWFKENEVVSWTSASQAWVSEAK